VTTLLEFEVVDDLLHVAIVQGDVELRLTLCGGCVQDIEEILRHLREGNAAGAILTTGDHDHERHRSHNLQNQMLQGPVDPDMN